MSPKRAPRATKIAASPAGARSDDSSATPSGPLVAEIGREVAAIFELIGRSVEPRQAPPRTPTLDGSAELLRSLQQGLLRYPIATQALFRTLVAEGREYARTPTGAQLEDQLLASSSFRGLRRIYESLTWHMLEEQGDRPLPSAYLDALAQVLSLDHLEPFLAGLHTVGRAPAKKPKG